MSVKAFDLRVRYHPADKDVQRKPGPRPDKVPR